MCRKGSWFIGSKVRASSEKGSEGSEGSSNEMKWVYGLWFRVYGLGFMV